MVTKFIIKAAAGKINSLMTMLDLLVMKNIIDDPDEGKCFLNEFYQAYGHPRTNDGEFGWIDDVQRVSADTVEIDIESDRKPSVDPILFLLDKCIGEGKYTLSYRTKEKATDEG